jgi:glycosyltransferase involved in cell wall biosynthesis
MKIVLVGLTYPFRGGIAHYTSLLFRELKKRHQVELISLKRQYPKILFPGKDQEDRSQERIEVENDPLIHPLNPWSWISTFSRIKSGLPDLILFQWWHPFFAPSFGTLALLLKRWGRAKVCYLCHNVRPHESTFFDNLLLKYAFYAPDHFIVHSESDLRELKRLRPDATVLKTPHPNYEIFKTGNEMEPVEARKELDIGGNLLLFFGYIRKYKGLEYLIQAFPKVLKEINCTLLIVGEIYEDKDKYLQMIEGSNAKDKIKLIDQYIPNEKVALYFTAADLVVLPYISATQSGIIQIAYGFNKPVVSTRVGGIPEAVVEGETGFLVDPKNANALAEAILRFYKDRETIDFSRNIEKVKERFSWERTVKVIESVYDGKT